MIQLLKVTITNCLNDFPRVEICVYNSNDVYTRDMEEFFVKRRIKLNEWNREEIYDIEKITPFDISSGHEESITLNKKIGTK